MRLNRWKVQNPYAFHACTLIISSEHFYFQRSTLACKRLEFGHTWRLLFYKYAAPYCALHAGVATITELSGAEVEEEKQSLPAHEGAFTVRCQSDPCDSHLNLCLAE